MELVPGKPARQRKIEQEDNARPGGTAGRESADGRAVARLLTEPSERRRFDRCVKVASRLYAELVRRLPDHLGHQAAALRIPSSMPTEPRASNTSATLHLSRLRALIAWGFPLNRMMSLAGSSKSTSG